MTASEIGRMTGLNSRTIRRWTDAGKIPSVRCKTKGGHYRYADTPALRQWIEENKTEPKKELPTPLGNLAMQLENDCKELSKEIINQVNASRHMGLLLQGRSGCKRLTQRFWIENCEGKLPFDFNTAKLHVSVANRLPKKVKTFREAWPIWKLFKPGPLPRSPA